MKKAAAFALLCALFVLAGCAGKEAVIINEATTIQSDEPTSAPGSVLEALSPATMRVEVPVTDLAATADEIDLGKAEGVLLGDVDLGYEGYSVTLDSLAGADNIYRLGDRYYFEYTDSSGRRIALYVAIPAKDDLYFAYYRENDLMYLWGGETAWYFSEGLFDFAVGTKVSQGGGYVYTFYNPAGNKIFVRVGDEYYGADNELLDSDELYQFKVRYGDAIEFDDE